MKQSSKRDGKITEASHANIAFVINGTIFTHPESEFILPGITRKNVLRIARENRNTGYGGGSNYLSDRLYH